MVKRIAFVFSLLCASTASAEIVDTARSLRSGDFSFAGDVQMGLNGSNPIALNLHQAIGLSGGVDLVLREGFGVRGGDGTYLGAAAKWSFGGRSVGLAAWLGGHLVLDSSAGMDGTLMVDFKAGTLTPFIAGNADLEFRGGPNDDVDLLLGVIFGTRIRLARKVGLFIEVGLGDLDFVAFGIRGDF